ncbi:longitudinals lacking protein isoform X17 [Agrilus planipennis]|uniref:Longitudinals lacking protein isoform X17 n=1 Tax=Agrilus planipennis TaxID=224129 RepID=A0A7F5RFE4_AGRPL|nr:longitudinals lacking protein isoform X17 [Agrilus planipennis]
MDDDQQFCLRWNNHQSTLVAVFDTLLENGTLVDCTLAAEGKFLNAHKVVLSACSPYFETLLSQNYDKHPIFILKDVKFQELKAMMDYMYRGEVNISQDQLGALLKAAESLQIKGLSDNRKGESETKKTVVPPPAKSPTPQTSTIPKVQGLTIEQRKSRDFDDTREGSQSPGPRKRKRIRRKSTDDLDNHQDASNSSESHSSQAPPVQNIPSSLPAASTIANVPEPIETKSEILTRHKTSVASNESDLSQVPIIKEKIETHSEIMLEPKSEYVEEMNEEESIEDLTLDDDDLSNMELSGNQGAGPSHGNAGEGSSQGFGNWHMGNQNQDEVFLAAQEAVGAHRDSQGFPECSMRRSKYFCTNKFICSQCGNRYRNKDNLRKHLQECGRIPVNKCPYCDYRAHRIYNIKTHMYSKHTGIRNCNDNLYVDNYTDNCT